MNFLNFLSVLVLTFNYHILKASAADNSFYTAGVVEFRPSISGRNSSELLADHLNAYLKIIESSEANDTDIIVFPEGTLNNEFHLTYVPSEKDKIIPCLHNESDTYGDFFMQLSCAARKVKKYLVINLTEKEKCPSNVEDTRPCSGNGLNIFNTNVVFDREGRVVSRYRKVNLYLENRNSTFKPEYAIFETDFGVRFGHFICFDMLFYTPAQELVDRFNVTDFIFTSLFYSELPFLTAVQLQHGWAWGNNVNLLAAGGSYPEWGMTGSGIYAGESGDLVSVMASEEGERKLYKAKVPKKSSKLQAEPSISIHSPKQNRAITKLSLMKDPQVKNYNSVILDLTPTESSFKKRLCDGDVCCSFEINAKIVNASLSADLKYRVGIFDGERTYEKEERSYIKVCALYACPNEDPSSCGEVLATENVLFKTIEINGQFPPGPKFLIMPSIINDALYPLKHDAVEWSKKMKRSHQDLRVTNEKPQTISFQKHHEISLKLVKEQTNIMTFGLYGQYYEKSTTDAASKLKNTFVFTLILFAFIAFVEL